MSRLDGIGQPPPLSFAGILFRIVRRRLGRVPVPVRIRGLSPPALRGYALMEQAEESASAVPKSLKVLAQLRVATRVGCPF